MRIRIIGFVAGLALLAIPASASASPWVRSCSNHGSGLTTNDGLFEVARWHVGMSAQTAGYLGRHYIGEFDSHVAPRQVPCFVGEWAVIADLKAWERSGSSATVGVTISGSGQEYVGQFRCTSDNVGTGADESCFHKARGQVGAITVRFRIRGAQ